MLGDDCWEWTGDKIKVGSAQGYGRFWYEGKTRRAHKWCYEWFFGPVPNELVVHHTCENKSCVNPKHLKAVTTDENLKASDTPARRNSRKTHCKRNHKFTKSNTRIDKKGSRVCIECQKWHQREYRKRKNTETV